jgi:hypothetical protein
MKDKRTRLITVLEGFAKPPEGIGGEVVKEVF